MKDPDIGNPAIWLAGALLEAGFGLMIAYIAFAVIQQIINLLTLTH